MGTVRIKKDKETDKEGKKKCAIMERNKAGTPIWTKYYSAITEYLTTALCISTVFFEDLISNIKIVKLLKD